MFQASLVDPGSVTQAQASLDATAIKKVNANTLGHAANANTDRSTKKEALQACSTGQLPTPASSGKATDSPFQWPPPQAIAGWEAGSETLVDVFNANGTAIVPCTNPLIPGKPGAKTPEAEARPSIATDASQLDSPSSAGLFSPADIPQSAPTERIGSAQKLEAGLGRKQLRSQTYPAEGSSTLEVTLFELRDRITEAMSSGDWASLVKILKQCYPVKVDSEVLKATKIGAEVNKLKHHVPTPELKALCLRVVRKWKADVGMLTSPSPSPKTLSKGVEGNRQPDKSNGTIVQSAPNGVTNGLPTTPIVASSKRRASLRDRRVISIDTSKLPASGAGAAATASAAATGHTRVDRRKGALERKRRASASAATSPLPERAKISESRPRKQSRTSSFMVSPPHPQQLTRRMSYHVVPSPRLASQPPLSARLAPAHDPEIRTLQSDSIEAPAEFAGNAARIGGLQVLYKSLASHTKEDSLKVFGIAKEIESLLNDQAWTGGSPVSPVVASMSSTSPESASSAPRIPPPVDYLTTPPTELPVSEPPKWNLATYRSRTLMYAFNLSNAHNTDFKGTVLSGCIPPSKLVTMTKEDMEPQNIQLERKRCQEQQDREIRKLTEIQVTPVRRWDYERRVST